MVDDFSAVEQTSGYIYQVRFALLLLLRDDGNRSLIIENLDDVEFGKNGTPQELIQFKHHVRRKGSLSDRSSDLWKTIRVWAFRILNDQVDINDVTLTIITTSISNESSIAGSIKNKNKTTDEIVEMLTEIAEQGGSETNKEEYKTFLNLTNQQKRDLVKGIRIVDGAPLNEELSGVIEKELKNAALPQHREKFRIHLEGWWLNRVVLSFSDERIKQITRSELDLLQEEIREGLKRENLPYYHDISDKVPQEQELKYQTRKYIKQLELITVSEDTKKIAMKDYYRAYEHRSRWLREELLGVSELPIYDTELLDEWFRMYSIMSEDLPANCSNESKIQEGKTLYRWASTVSNVNIPTRPHWNHVFLTRGSYHMLADEIKIGWYPGFESYFIQTAGRVGGNVNE